MVTLNNVSSETLTQAIPEHLIIDQILPRLPVKSLIRFKSVSKSWYSTISSPQFAKSHLNFSPHQFLLLINNPFNFMLLPYDDVSNNLKTLIQLDFLRVPFVEQQLSESNVEIVGSSNGLVCYCGITLDELCFFLICNPAMRLYNYIMLPNPGYYTVHSWHWFGYVPSVNDYKIVGLLRLYVDNSCRCSVHFYVFSLRSGEWKRMFGLDDYFTGYEILSQETTLINDGVLYWSFRFPNHEEAPKRVVGFDFVTEELKHFSWMDWLGDYTRAEFFSMNGCLSLRCQLKAYFSDVWMLKKYDDWSSWEKLFYVHLPSMTVCSITPTGKFLVKKYSVDEYMLIDPCQDTQERSHGGIYCPGEVCWWTVVGYAESLISPFGMNE